MATRVTDPSFRASRHSRARALLSLNLKKKRDCSQSKQAPVFQTLQLDCAVYRIKICLVDNTIGFPDTYPLDSDLSGGLRYLTFKPAPGAWK